MTPTDGPTRLMPGPVPEELKLGLQSFAIETENKLMNFYRMIENIPIPPTIYHYTNDIGLNGIIGSGKVWLTDIFQLNDPTELSHGFNRLSLILRDMATTPVLKVFSDHIAGFTADGGVEHAGHVYACSFSSKGDDLGQWRAYGDNGCGFALGFDAALLEAGFGSQNNDDIAQFSSFPVDYSDEKLDKIQRKFAEKAIPLVTAPIGLSLTPRQTMDYIVHLLSILSFFATNAALYFKHPAYESEQEYRFLEIHRRGAQPPPVKHRVRRNAFIDYREFDWRGRAPSALRRIVVGPAADKSKAIDFARQCLITNRIEGVEIVASQIPYRIL